jgi:hypothetical protein
MNLDFFGGKQCIIINTNIRDHNRCSPDKKNHIMLFEREEKYTEAEISNEDSSEISLIRILLRRQRLISLSHQFHA